jgi:hypothetical protein
MEDCRRFVAQVMTFGDWNETLLTMNLLGTEPFRQALLDAPAGIFDIKSWTYWHQRLQLPLTPLPRRRI